LTFLKETKREEMYLNEYREGQKDDVRPRTLS
jgi:hypothetical protein